MDIVTYEDFKKIDLRVVKILDAERIKSSDKLIKIQVDLGEEKRQIIAGIGKVYNPEDLIGKQVVIVSNLEPKILFGLESRGMILAASDAEQIALLVPDKKILSGSIIE
ncbi:MAG: methionine--tRNA ligase subunit beta [Candidatus Liptonbacteria bacterium]|nr:methionine--tRNA ligase subunit beta [Candidatus Liptonbacteria bacterium]